MENSRWPVSFFIPDTLVQREYNRIVTATIVRTNRICPRKPDLECWEATVSTISSAPGVPRASTFIISRRDGSCIPGEPTPKVGHTWILYLNRDGQRYYPAYSLPFAKARKIDPRFTGQNTPGATTLSK
ncbi:hypothetical protein [Sphingobium aromaticiconvertens]|uniref:hypothetical protein n=1 Tax=Sphingobium aromaticiconvertens TaxID=365341 RepID=UPI0030196FB7